MSKTWETCTTDDASQGTLLEKDKRYRELKNTGKRIGWMALAKSIEMTTEMRMIEKANRGMLDLRYTFPKPI
jgi:hypothetical protein